MIGFGANSTSQQEESCLAEAQKCPFFLARWCLITRLMLEDWRVLAAKSVGEPEITEAFSLQHSQTYKLSSSELSLSARS